MVTAYCSIWKKLGVIENNLKKSFTNNIITEVLQRFLVLPEKTMTLTSLEKS